MQSSTSSHHLLANRVTNASDFIATRIAKGLHR